MKSAIVHDWLVSPIGGAENTLQEIFSLFNSPIYTLVWHPEHFENSCFASAKVISSFIQKLPWAKKGFRSYLPIFPLGIEQFDLGAYELVLSSSHCIAHGVLTHSEQLHICYCHTPMRYSWDLTYEYLRESGLNKGLKGVFAKLILHYLRNWDVHASRRVDHYIANSRFVARRIKKFYGREATVIHPPVDTSFFSLSNSKDKYYLTCSRLVSYKKINLIVEAFAQMPDLKLLVIGDGPEAEKIRKKARPNIELLGSQTKPALKGYLQKAKAFIFASLEDFGIAPIEAMACGTPVLAYGKGGIKESVLEGKTGNFFHEQSSLAIQHAVRQFERQPPLDPSFIHQHASRFSQERFRSEFHSFVINRWEEWKKMH